MATFEEPAPRPLETTSDLLHRVRTGDGDARERLVRRVLPVLRRWAHGRLPGYARDLSETDDLVHIALVRALDHVEGFECRREGAFLAYLRRILLNLVRDEIRRTRRRPIHEELPDEPGAESPVVQAVGVDLMRSYEKGLEKLTEEQREAVLLRVEFGYSFPEIAEAIGSPSTNAARMFVSRALLKIAEMMRDTP